MSTNEYFHLLLKLNQFCITVHIAALNSTDSHVCTAIQQTGLGRFSALALNVLTKQL